MLLLPGARRCSHSSLIPSLTSVEDLAGSLEYSLCSAMHSHKGLDFMAPLL